jgi:uncharacterized membrane-anchored protein
MSGWMRALLICGAVLLPAIIATAADTPDSAAAGTGGAESPASPAEVAYLKALGSLHWVKGPTSVDVSGNSKLAIPQGYVYLDKANTDKYLELNQNLAGGEEVMVAPEDLHWTAFLSFNDEGYVKDDDKIDAAALLKTMKEATESSNAERRKRGWRELHIVDWAVAPAYNTSTKRLEWATVLESDGARDVNFSTKVLGRRGHTSVILVSSVDGLAAARPELETLLGGYSFNKGDTYGEWVPGDKVAEYGLAALVLGGAAAIAAKKGLWTVFAGFLAAGWKFLAAGAVALMAGLRRFFGKKTDDRN